MAVPRRSQSSTLCPPVMGVLYARSDVAHTDPRPAVVDCGIGHIFCEWTDGSHSVWFDGGGMPAFFVITHSYQRYGLAKPQKRGPEIVSRRTSKWTKISHWRTTRFTRQQ